MLQEKIKQIIKKFRELLAKLFHKYFSQLPYVITSLIVLLTVVGGIKIFIKLTENLSSDVLVEFDTNITQSIVAYRSPGLTNYLKFVTDVGDVYGYLIVFLLCTVLFYVIFKNWNYVGQLSLVLFLALSSNIILKQIINRSRPDLDHLVTVETLSYPSGHAMTAMAFYGFLIYLFYRFKIRTVLKFVAITLLTILILSIGISRIYLGVHYPSDIIGGFIAGFIWVIFCAFIFNVIRVFKKDPTT